MYIYFGQTFRIEYSAVLLVNVFCDAELEQLLNARLTGQVLKRSHHNQSGIKKYVRLLVTLEERKILQTC
jgi:hypothetical protein